MIFLWTTTMAPNPPREQEQSIKDRKRLLYDDDEPPVSASADSKPFAVYLRETPARPLSAPVKAALWAAAIAVGLLLAGALMKSTQGKPPTKKRAEVSPPRVTSPLFA
ncbi:MAG: hypothetical protein JWN86_3911 [Planctomycetota bacterium]|nr:hypothetical protein [Planctomycetota bacterium]